MRVLGLEAENRASSLLDFLILDSHLVADLQDLLVEVSLGYSNTGMGLEVVVSAKVTEVVSLIRFELLSLSFARDWLATDDALAVMPLLFQEDKGENRLSRNRTDLFSTEMSYSVFPTDLPTSLPRVNRLRAKTGIPPLTIPELTREINQFKEFIDPCQVFDIAVIAVVVFNYSGASPGNTPSTYNLDDQSICFLIGRNTLHIRGFLL